MFYDLDTIIRFTKHGIYCPAGDFWIDPSIKAETAIITHAHSDHARRGHGKYICHIHTGSLLKLFFGEKTVVLGLNYKEEMHINGVKVTLFPAGHVLGSAQVLLEYNDVRVVVAGDYKVANDKVTPAFEPVQCDVFVTESTFGKPKYIWQKQEEIFAQIHQWWKGNQEKGVTSILVAYSLGKAQRILANLDYSIGKVLVSKQISEINGVYTKHDLRIPQLENYENTERTSLEEVLIVTAAAGLKHKTIERLKKKDIAQVSGWVLDNWIVQSTGFALSDHADWPGLLCAIEQSKARRIYVQHGFTSYFTKYLKNHSIDAFDVQKCATRDQIELF